MIFITETTLFFIKARQDLHFCSYITQFLQLKQLQSMIYTVQIECFYVDSIYPFLETLLKVTFCL